jgi:hypothetical protein
MIPRGKRLRLVGCVASASAVIFVQFGYATAGTVIAPGGAPPVAFPLPPPAPAIGSKFVPPTRIIPGQPIPVSSVHEIESCRFGIGNWLLQPNPVFVQDSLGGGAGGIGNDHLHWRQCVNFVQPPGRGFYTIYYIFGANPWGVAPPAALVDSQLTGSFGGSVYSPMLPEPMPVKTYSYLVVLTDSEGKVRDVIDPLLIVGVDPPGDPICPIQISRPECGPGGGEEN